ncbi:DEAD/DEAH box helicase family protein [Mobiluncus mulieris]|uniref:DEAD/DEAH box helicase n=1 Tax=Mobiluncus mulieris TaxID=2052 RepID=UPI0014700925|nr:DEAD/DEAH box helicase family protein [Mobiluncus mulieris]MCU9996186.1 restriction endonuclease [Mobiluncus mulieris]MCV0012856.1 restriction endonuclease [Mobiluncus mulieris]NMW60171.1 DEAD/DEAH box helicase family protein [Mobiluncus mulieris]
MPKRLQLTFDSELLETISADFDLRAPNREALRQLAFVLDGDYDPEVMQVLNLATGVGKTYLMAAFIEYLRAKGVGNAVIVTPGKVVQAKTIANFTPGQPGYIAGSPVPPDIVTPQNYAPWIARLNSGTQPASGAQTPVLAFIFNIHQLIAPKTLEGDTHGSGQEAMKRKPRRFDENAGVLFDYLRELDDLVVIADESHLYGVSAEAFHGALRELQPAAMIGLTASVDKTKDHVIYEYPLYRAIQDRYVKAPVLAFRKGGYTGAAASEEQQLRDAIQLRAYKQDFYDTYADTHSRARLNAVLLVLCADTEHADQITSLLRTSEYFGSDFAVLQVDSNHDKEDTNRFLAGLEKPDSPVKAVVSVNKLKEGWDVKNVAVIVTLRAMASEVLTQQTMGRGLRLPFGAYTGVGQIDQLDIIAHQSFEELLDAENVLQQFGLEQAVKDSDPSRVRTAIRQAAEQASGGDALDGTPDASADGSPDGRISASRGVSIGVETSETGQPGMTIRHIPETGTSCTPNFPEPPQVVTITRNPDFAEVTYTFPVTTVKQEQPRFDLSAIPRKTIADAAKRVTSAKDVLLRKEIVAALGKDLHGADLESAEVDSIPVAAEAAEHALVKLVLNLQQVPKTPETAGYVKSFLVPIFCNSVDFAHWTVKTLGCAQALLRKIISDYIKELSREIREVPVIHPKTMPGSGYILLLGEKVHAQIDNRRDFVRGRVYAGWFKSLFSAESFDSYTGEYELAKLLNTSPSIVWWHRLHPADGAFVSYNALDRYFPDFVALDRQGVHWIIEAKSERGRDDATVAAKRRAAEALVQRLAAETAFAGQYWGYLIGFESDIAAADSWDDLKALAQPVSNLV